MPARVSSGIGQPCLPDCAACWGRTANMQRLHLQRSPSCTKVCKAGAVVQAAPLHGCRASSLAREVLPAERLQRVQPHRPGTRPSFGGTVPGNGQGPSGRRSWMPSSGAPLRKTASMAPSRVGISWTLAWSSRSQGKAAAAPAAAAAAAAAAGWVLAAVAAGLLRFSPRGRRRLIPLGLRWRILADDVDGQMLVRRVMSHQTYNTLLAIN